MRMGWGLVCMRRELMGMSLHLVHRQRHRLNATDLAEANVAKTRALTGTDRHAAAQIRQGKRRLAVTTVRRAQERE
jgi:hypothetical protein